MIEQLIDIGELAAELEANPETMIEQRLSVSGRVEWPPTRTFTVVYTTGGFCMACDKPLAAEDSTDGICGDCHAAANIPQC